MKLVTRTLSLITTASLVLFFANCGGSEGSKTPTEKKQLGKLTGTWVLTQATLAGGTPADKTSDYDGFTLTLSGTFDADSEEEFPYSYATTNRPDLSPWEASGDWGFGANPKTQVVRDDDQVINYTISSNGNLTLMFTYSGDGFPSAKLAEVEGSWTLEFEPAN